MSTRHLPNAMELCIANSFMLDLGRPSGSGTEIQRGVRCEGQVGRGPLTERGRNRIPKKIEWPLYSVNKTLLASL